jgi:ketosteroid isomerase-like protein
MAQGNLEIIEELYAAFARGDGPAVLAAMDEGIVWNEAEHAIYADRNPYLGPAAIAEGIFTRYATEWEGFQAIPAQFLATGDRIVVTGRYHGLYKATESTVDAQFAHFWSLRDGKIVAFQQYTDTTQPAR